MKNSISVAVIEYPKRTWRVRAWIRAFTVLQSLGWIALVAALGFSEPLSVWGVIGPILFVIVPPYLAFRPVVKLGDHGELLLRGWLFRRQTNVAQIRKLAMTQFGLKVSLADNTSFTTVVFQATISFGRPRVLEFVDAIRRDNLASKNFDPDALFYQSELEIYSIDDPNR